MSRPKEITTKLKVADPELSAYVVGLEKENLRLHKIIIKAQVESISKDNQIKALKQQASKARIKVVVQNFGSPEKNQK